MDDKEEEIEAAAGLELASSTASNVNEGCTGET